ncbi:MAG: hypothetical protein OEX12_11630 [Gammaproteobacteria bacterium]|nr:hypothetical protein [Gammaproteobacteria bacterium]
MRQICPDTHTVQFRNVQYGKIEPEGLAYVRVDQEGRIIAVFSDNSEMDVSEIFTLSITDD